MVLRTVATRLFTFLYAAALTGGITAASSAPAPARGILSSIELTRTFGATPGWRFTAVQGPDIPDPIGETGDEAPGAIRLCISLDGGRTCGPRLDQLLASSDGEDLFSQPHFLIAAGIVHPRPDLPLLLLQVASLRSGDGDQRVATIALAYDHVRSTFVPAYQKQTGRNNNQEIRYIEGGPLRGAIVSAEPTSNAPFGFWITISRVGPGNRYGQVLRYRSATMYGDGNPLAVIDSEMPSLQQRLGLRRPGAKLALPAGPCPSPRLVGRELWCFQQEAPHRH